MAKKPKPATVDANSHREDEEDEDDGQAHADIPDDATPSGTRDGGGGGGGGDPDTGGAGGSLSMFKSKNLLIVAGVAVGGFLVWQYLQNYEGNVSVESVKPDSDEQPPEEQEPVEPDITDDPNDPLRADDEAMDYVFGDKSNYSGGD